MNWIEYKSQVKSSRELIIKPLLDDFFRGKKGSVVDIGCGDGELTKRISDEKDLQVIGVDINTEFLKKARACSHKNLHFIEGNVEKNSLSSIGIEFDFAVSNCCFSHISDEGVNCTLVDLYQTMKSDGKFIFIVPSFSWATNNYSDQETTENGITALTRYGNRQRFRLSSWYISTLNKCGFECKLFEIKIPKSDELEDRYRKNIGEIIFDVYIGKRKAKIPNIYNIEKAFNIAHDNRKLEISLFWQRSLFFWGFVASALVAFGSLYGKNNLISSFVAIFGVVCSVTWSLVNRGSKYWQEYWERKVSYYQRYVTGNIFHDKNPVTTSVFNNYSGRRISVSKLAMALSDYTVFMWICLIFSTIYNDYFLNNREIFIIIYLLISLFYCLFISIKLKTKDE